MGAKTHYNMHNKELLAIIKALEEWRFLLEGTEIPVMVFTDHRNLEYWQGSRKFNQWHAQRRLLLAKCLFKIIYRAGKQLGKPDTLPQRSDHLDVPPKPQTMLPKEQFEEVQAVESEIALQERIVLEQKQDETLEEIFAFLQQGGSAPQSVAKGFKDYTMEGDLLMYRGKILMADDKPLKRDLIAAFHDTPSAGRPEQQRTLGLVSRSYYWLGIRSRVYEHVDSCEDCQRNRVVS